MSSLNGKHIILGISGSIAAYKSALLTRLLVKAGAEVQVLMTPAAATFITPLTLHTLSGKPVYAQVSTEAGWNNHVELGLWADAYLLAPATANTLAQMAQGLCDNMVTAVYLSARCPVFFAPAMDLDMWKHPATQANVARLQGYGDTLIPVGRGELASGLVGEGRMAEPEDIRRLLEAHFDGQQLLAGKRVLITAGPTHEPIDPVRFIGNRSSGRMGIALAEAAAAMGASVKLVLGPSALGIQHPKVEVERVETAREMFQATLRQFPGTDLAVLAAAVADYRPAEVAEHKIKKTAAENPAIALVKNPDIAATLGEQKQPGQLVVGFALETKNEEAHARSKMERKNMDLIVLNSLRDEGAGFEQPTNKVTLFDRNNKRRALELKTKEAVARDILRAAAELMKPARAGSPKKTSL